MRVPEMPPCGTIEIVYWACWPGSTEAELFNAESEKSGLEVKLAAMLVSLPITTVQVPVPLQPPPDHPVN
jgi:hypothetical protein